MFCPNCGNQIADNMKFCPKCGSSTEIPPSELNSSRNQVPSDTVQPQYTYTGSVATVTAPPKDKKFFIIGGIALGAVILIIFMVLALGGKGASSPEKAVEKYMYAIVDRDFDKAASVMSKSLKLQIAGDCDASDKQVANALQLRYTLLGGDMPSKITDFYAYSEYLPDDEVAEIIYEYKAYCDHKSDEKITDVAIVEFVYTARVDGETETDDGTMYCICVGGKWYVCEM